MKYSSRNMLFGLSIIFATVTVLAVSSVPAAFADPDPSPGANPNPAVVDTIVDITVVSSVRSWVDELIVYDTPTPPAEDGLCALTIPTGVESWRLVSSANTAIPIRAFIPAIAPLAPLGIISAPFGTGVGSPILVTSSGGAFLTADGSTPPTVAGLTSVSGTWLEVGDTAGTPAPTTDRIGDYRIGVCGKENALTYAAASNYDVSSPFTIQKPVGGEIIPVSTTALLLAGVSTSALWLIPLAAIAAGAFAVLRFQIYRN